MKSANPSSQPSAMLLSSRQTAVALGISTTTLHRYVKAGKIECVRFAVNSVYFTQQQIDDFIDRHRKRYAPIHPESRIAE